MHSPSICSHTRCSKQRWSWARRRCASGPTQDSCAQHTNMRTMSLSSSHLCVSAVPLLTSRALQQICLGPARRGHLSISDGFLGELLTKFLHGITCHLLDQQQKRTVLFSPRIMSMASLINPTENSHSLAHTYYNIHTSVVMTAILAGVICPQITFCLRLGFFMSPRLEMRLLTLCLYLPPVSLNSA